MKPNLFSIDLWKRHFQRMALAFLSAILVFSIVTPARAIGVYEMPFLTPDDPMWIVDRGNTISRINENQIGQALSQLKDDTDIEVRFVTIRHLDYGETMQSFTDALFEKWFPTPESQTNQVLLTLDVLTNNSAIHVGEAARSTLTPEIAESVAQETLLYPLIKGDKYNEAFLSAKDRLIAVLSGEADPGAPSLDNNIQVEGTFATAEETEAQKGDSTTLVIVLLLAATVIPMVTYFVLYQ
ncbi:MAG: TPM domain-containing protein [Cyanobacteria bacterium SID2]|nr:TPM domain-containing protein [Cyanobacteria bacterium SID2]MBP0002900.1 TPM domain-containing protein [Cyanobacteria bacterium SBC]